MFTYDVIYFRTRLSDLIDTPPGTHKVSSIKIAEAAKIIENCQRDINIAFVNELAMLFNKLEIDTKEVLDASKTKWNFQPYTPGLVGGHCIGVDPYYLSHKAKSIGVHSDLILTSRSDTVDSSPGNLKLLFNSFKGSRTNFLFFASLCGIFS